MAERWCNVTSRFGDLQVGSPPSDQEIAVVLNEILDEPALLRRVPTLTEGDLDEHPCAAIEAGEDGGPLYTLEAYGGGWMQFLRYSDVDMTDEELCLKMEDVSIAEAERLWRALRDGRLAEVEAAFSGPVDPGSGDE